MPHPQAWAPAAVDPALTDPPHASVASTVSTILDDEVRGRGSARKRGCIASNPGRVGVLAMLGGSIVRVEEEDVKRAERRLPLHEQQCPSMDGPSILITHGTKVAISPNRHQRSRMRRLYLSALASFSDYLALEVSGTARSISDRWRFADASTPADHQDDTREPIS